MGRNTIRWLRKKDQRKQLKRKPILSRFSFCLSSKERVSKRSTQTCYSELSSILFQREIVHQIKYRYYRDKARESWLLILSLELTKEPGLHLAINGQQDDTLMKRVDLITWSLATGLLTSVFCLWSPEFCLLWSVESFVKSSGNILSVLKHFIHLSCRIVILLLRPNLGVFAG